TDSLQRQFLIPLVCGAVTVLVAMGVEVLHLRSMLGEGAMPSAQQLGAAWRDHVWALAGFGLCGFTLATIVQEFARGLAVARRNNPKLSLLDAGIRLLVRARRRYGGYVIHLGVVLMFFGFAGKAYGIERKVNLVPGQTVELGAYEIRHSGLRATEDWQKEDRKSTRLNSSHVKNSYA